jgi:hypothetical protein
MAQFLASNQMLGLALGVVLLALGWSRRGALGDLVGAPERGWRVVAWVAFLTTLAVILWFTFADDWRKVFGELLDVREQYLSQRAVPIPVDPALRRVSFVLLVPALICGGALFARYLGGYGLQIILVLLGISAFFPLYLIRQRLDTGLAGILDLPSLFSLAGIAIAFYLLLDWAANIALILTSYLGLVGFVALPVTLFLDLTGLREGSARPSAEATSFYTQIGEGVRQRRAAADERPADPSDEARH